MKRRTRLFISIFVVVGVMLSSLPTTAWASPAIDTGTTPGSVEATGVCQGYLRLNTGTSILTINNCPVNDGRIEVEFTPFGNEHLRTLPALGEGLTAAGEGVIFSSNFDDLIGQICFPLPPSGSPVIYFLNSSNDWVPVLTYPYTNPVNGRQFVCTDGGLGTYLPVFVTG